MSRLIISIAFKNFYNYYGKYEDNTYSFNKGLNIIVADNGFGKSKFFNGILWILKDKVIDTDRMLDDNNTRETPVEQTAFTMVSDRKKMEAEVNQSIVSGVRLKFQVEENIYTVEKTISCVKQKIGSPTDVNCWKTSILSTSVEKEEGKNSIPIYDLDEQKEIIMKIIKPDFRKYLLLQGEEVDRIIDFSNEDSLTSAVNTITNISKVSQLIKDLVYYKRRAEKDLNEQRRTHTKNKKLLDEKIAEKEKRELEYNQYEKELANYHNTLHDATLEREKLLNEKSNAQARKKIRDKIDKHESEKNLLEDLRDQQQGDINSKFFDENYGWIALGTKNVYDVFSNSMESYNNVKAEKRVVQEMISNPEKFIIRLPDGSPDFGSLVNMLKEEECFVCGRKAEKGTKEWLHIERIKDRPSPKSGKLISRNDFSKFFSDLQREASPFYSKVDKVMGGIKEMRKENSNTKKNILKKDEAISKLFQELISFGGNIKDEMGQVSDSSTLDSFENAVKRITENKGKIKIHDQKLKQLATEIKTLEKNIEDLSGDNIPKEYQQNYQIISDLEQITKNAKVRIFDEMLEKLEKNSNKHFQDLVKTNNVNGGILKFSKILSHRENIDYTINIEVVDDDDNQITGLSEGFQRMKKLAVVMAIISSTKQGSFDYPFIADAPLSAFGKGFIEGFFNEVPNAFSQSIILVKELYDESNKKSRLTDFGERLLNKMKTNKLVGTFYLNEITGKRSTTTNTNITTKISPYHQ